MKYDVIVIGGGPAGLAAALAAWNNGARRVLVLERSAELGGILNQCIHNGFGLHYFKQELTGPEYAGRFVTMLDGTGVEIITGAMVLRVDNDKTVYAVSETHGYMVLCAGAVVLAMGCRERTRGALAIPGTRPAGVFTAGTAQLYMNIHGQMVGRRVVILGSGDIGLIMARRMTLEGAVVLACVEVMPYSGGLARNLVQCLEDYGIPLYLSHTVTRIRGDKRVEGVTVARVDENRAPVAGTEFELECDTVLLSVGLIPENELSRGAGAELDPRTGGLRVYENMETTLPGVFAGGNVVHVHDLVDFVTGESERAGRAAALCALGKAPPPSRELAVENGPGVAYTVPQALRPGNVKRSAELFLRVRDVYQDASLVVSSGDQRLCAYKKEHLAPGEMERILLPKALLEQAGDAITVSVEQNRAGERGGVTG